MERLAKICSNCGLLSAETGNGCKSNSSVGGGYFSGRIRWRNETGNTVSLPSHRSDTMRMKYSGGSGSNTGTNIFTTCSSSQYFLHTNKGENTEQKNSEICDQPRLDCENPISCELPGDSPNLEFGKQFHQTPKPAPFSTQQKAFFGEANEIFQKC